MSDTRTQPRFAVGDRVFHRGTKAHATVVEVRPQRTYEAEYLVQPDKPLIAHWPNDPTWWASYHAGPESEAPW